MPEIKPMRDTILEVINNAQGIKNVELSLKVMDRINPVKFNFQLFLDELQKLVDDKEVIEIEYVLSNMNYRIKSFYLPKGTKCKQQ